MKYNLFGTAGIFHIKKFSYTKVSASYDKYTILFFFINVFLSQQPYLYIIEIIQS